ncbi:MULTISPECIES: CoxG family protein [Falsihalocynthiibacter]|uniref:CoxG family protein n=1 Tax=Falsihalocynthiibacter TaxID=2854182 RepID=UPI003002E9E0
MELQGTQPLSATPDQVWTALFDRDVLERAIPGCESLEQTSDTSFSAVVKLKIGPVSARFKGDVELSDIDPGKSCTLSGKGSGGIAGFAKGAARMTLTPEGDGTVLDYTADVAIGGKLAALGNRLIKATAQKLTSEFFANFTTALTGEAKEPAA